MLDDSFMRDGDPERVAQLLSQPPVTLPIKILDVRELFLSWLKGLRDAEARASNIGQHRKLPAPKI